MSAADPVPSPQLPLTVVVLTNNEEQNLPACLASLSPAAQLVVVDSGSTDRTIELARVGGALVLDHPWPGFAAQRNWALEHAQVQHDWVLFVDADERVPPALWDEIADFLARPRAVAGSFRRSAWFLGTQLRHGGFGTARVVRLMGRSARYPLRLVHEHPLVRGPIHRFSTPIVHDDQRPFEAWLARHNDYSTLEARARALSQADDDASSSLGVRTKRFVRRKVWPHLPARPLLFFLYVYVLRRGFLDGKAGLRIAALYGFQELAVQIKLEALEQSRAPDADGSPPATP